MGKLITVDDIEITFEEQNPNHACNWCIYIRVRKKGKEKNILMIRTNNKPYTKCMFNSGNVVKNSKKTLNKIISNIVKLTNPEKEIFENAVQTTKKIKKK